MARKFPYGKTILIGFGFLGISLIWPIFNNYIPIFLQAGNPDFNAQLLEEGKAIPDVVGFGLSPVLAMFIMTWDNIINMFIQPWVGERSDRTWNRFGRRKPWILLGAPIAVLGFIFVPVAQSVIAIAVFILITNFGMALFRSPTISWLGDLYEPNERSKANGVINMMGGVGGLLAYFGGAILFDRLGRSAPFIAGAIAMLLALAAVLIYIKEPKDILAGKAPSKGVLANLKDVINNPDKSGLWVLFGILFWFTAFNALETALSSFAVFVLGAKPSAAGIYAGMVTVSFILFSIPAGILGSRIGRRKTILIGLTGFVPLLLLGYFIIQGVATLVSVLVIAGALWAMVNVNSLPLVYDYGDERRIGAYTGLYYFSSQLAAIAGPVLAGALVNTLGSQYRWVWLFSTVFMALAWLAMTQVRAKKIAAVQPAEG